MDLFPGLVGPAALNSPEPQWAGRGRGGGGGGGGTPPSHIGRDPPTSVIPQDKDMTTVQYDTRVFFFPQLRVPPHK